MSRLAFIRYLHWGGIEQAKLPDPPRSTSVLQLHDAVEAMLMLISEIVGIDPPYKFEDYWKKIKSPFVPQGVQVPMQEGMRRLNSARRELKHHGHHPPAATIDQAIHDASAFMSGSASLFLGIDYDAVSMADLITQAEVREQVKSAETLAAAGDEPAAMISLCDAFEVLFQPHEANDGFRGRQTSPFAFGPAVRYHRLSQRDIEAVFRPGADAHQPEFDPHKGATWLNRSTPRRRSLPRSEVPFR